MIDRNLSYSQIKVWQECRRQWGYQYLDGYRKKQQRLDFMRGTLLHLGMQETVCEPDEAFDLGWERAMKAWADEYEPKANDLMVPPSWFEECKSIVWGARAVFLTDWEVIELNGIPMLEERMYAKLPDFYRGIVFIPDVIAVKRTDPFLGGVFGVDFKSYAKPKPLDAGLMDLQGAIYQRGLRENGFPAIGTCLFQLAVEGRKPIRYRKDGQPYQGDQERFDNWSAVSGQILTIRSEEFLDGVWEQIVLPTAMEMHDAEQRALAQTLVPAMSYYKCSYCDFKEPCFARLKGLDEAAILSADFNRREPRQKGESSAEKAQG